MTLTRLAAVALLVCIPAASHAAQGSAPPATPADAPADTAAEPEKPKKICRIESSTGSVMRRRVCRTPEQMEADEEAARRTRQEMERSRGGL